VRITNAAATPADASTTLVTVRAVVSVIDPIAYELFRGPEDDGVEPPRIESPDGEP
jgi:hypothetical protein